jgi:hypothetical protein
MEARHLKTAWAEKLQIAILGAINGVVYSATMLLLIWRWRAASDERHMIESALLGDHIQLAGNERWIPIVIIWLVAFTLASLVVDYFWKFRKDHILYWVAIGVIAIAAWNAFALLGAWLDKQAGDTISYSRVTSSQNPIFGPISIAVVILVNFVYGYLVVAFYRKLKQRYDVEKVDLQPSP